MDGSSFDPGDTGLLVTVLLNIFSADLLFYGFSSFVLVALLLGSGIISGAEVAFFSLTPAERIKCKTSSNVREVKIFKVLENPKQLLATILIINNLFNVAFITLSTYMTWKFSAIGTDATLNKDPSGYIVVFLTVVVSFAIVFFGEVTPKIYANKRGIEVAKLTVNFVSAAFYVFKPFAYLLISMGDFIDKRVQKISYTLSVEEMNKAIDLTANQHSTEGETDILKGIVNFGTISVKQIMTVRPDITAVDIDISFRDLIAQINHFGYSRVPVYNDTIDKIEGVLHIKDFLPYIHYHEFDWHSLIRDLYFIPENKKIDILLKDFQEMRVHMAVVVDEYGGTSGLITLEDIIEEIVGEINDEFDDEIVLNFEKLNDQEFVFEGKISLNDFCKIIETDPDIFNEVKGESESLGGLLLELNAGLPKSGDLLAHAKFAFEIISADKRRIKKIKVKINS